MNSQEDKAVSIIGTIVGISVILAVICGLLECFGIGTGAVGAIFVVILLAFLVIFVIWQIIKGLIK